jgi:pseudaminic acid synthase
MKIKIGKKIISEDRMYVVAEISANHDGSISRAKKLISFAKKAGVDAVKIQSYSADSITINSNKKDFQIEHLKWKKYKNFYKLYQKGQTPNKWIKELFLYAKKIKIDIFSSPFDEKAVDELEKYGCIAYKIASPEINHIPLLKKVAKTQKPIIISTGVANLKDIKLAIDIIKKNGNKKIILLKCDSTYPAKFEDANLNAIPFLKKKFNVKVGYSDHTADTSSALLSFMFGSCLVERHFDLKNKRKTLDSFFSSDFEDLKKLIIKLREIEKFKKEKKYILSKSAKKNRNLMRSIYVNKNVKKNDLITELNIKVVRPAYGADPINYFDVIGKKFNKNLDIGDRLHKSYVKK